MEVRVISDLHIDINKNVKWNFNPKEFYIVCGDVSGNADKTIEFMKEHVKRGVFVAGNHLGYSDETPLEQNLKKLRSTFNKGTLRFLNNNVYRVSNIVFIGCTLWTDFLLFGNRELGMRTSWEGLNDYRYVRVEGGRLTPQITESMHNKSLEYLKAQLEKYKDYKVVVVTHHAPSMKAVSPIYAYDQLSSAFASNLDYLMQRYKNIALWAHGHMHSKTNYMVGDTKVICNPYGYYNENDMDMNDLGVKVEI